MTHKPPPHSIEALWADARAWIGVLLTRFGGPARILLALGGRTRAAVKRRLAAIETLVLKLLLIEALTLAPAKVAAPDRAAARRRDAVTHAAEDPERPETWRVRYSPRLPRIRRHAAVRRAGHSAPPREPALIARTLARRCEALRRLIADHRPAARILARKLRALGEFACDAARRIATRPPAMRRTRDRMRIALATTLAWAALNSS